MRFISAATKKIEKIVRGNPLLFKIYARPYKKTVKREINLAEISSDDTILNIGCGALPFTAYFMSTYTRAEIIAVDYDPEILSSARRCLQQNLPAERARNIQVVNMSGVEAVRNLDFSIVMAALQTENKVDILRELCRSGIEKWRYITREPRNGLEGEYDSLSSAISPHGRIDQYFPTFDCSVLYTAKSCSEWERNSDDF